DAGLARTAVDGYVCMPGRSGAEDLRYMGLAPKFSWAMQTGGATAVATIIAAMGALELGLADYVLCVGGENLSSARVNVGAFGYGYPQMYGMFGAAAAHALHARRHMHRFGTTSRQLG